MGRSQETFSKKEREKKRIQKRQEKEKKREERKNNPNAEFEDMIAYVDANGNLTDTPPDPTKKKKIDPTTIEISVGKREAREDVPREGKVSFFNDEKGYGFIRDFEAQEDFFVHINGCLEDIAEGDKVTYSLERGMKGMNAVEVKKI